MSWARRQADRKIVHQVLVRCKNTRHKDKRIKVLERELRKEMQRG